MPSKLNPKNYYGWRKLVILRDGKCVLCGSIHRLEADHIKPFSKYPILRFSQDNGRTLCHLCHKKTDTYGGKARTYNCAEDSNA